MSSNSNIKNMNLQVIKNIAYMFAILIILLIIIFYNLYDSKNSTNNNGQKLNFENLVDYTINIERLFKIFFVWFLLYVGVI